MNIWQQYILLMALLYLPPELWIKIALASGPELDEYAFNLMARAIPALGRWTIGIAPMGHWTPASNSEACIIDRRLDLMITFGYRVICTSRSINWLRRDYYHRNDVPAIILSKGICTWIKHGAYHRVGGPAYINYVKDRYIWYINGKKHRDDGPAYIAAVDDLLWYQYGRISNYDACIDKWPGAQLEWYQHGKICRKDGPAVVWRGFGREYCVCSAKLAGEWPIMGGEHWCAQACEIRIFLK